MDCLKNSLGFLFHLRNKCAYVKSNILCELLFKIWSQDFKEAKLKEKSSEPTNGLQWNRDSKFSPDMVKRSDENSYSSSQEDLSLPDNKPDGLHRYVIHSVSIGTQVICTSGEHRSPQLVSLDSIYRSSDCHRWFYRSTKVRYVFVRFNWFLVSNSSEMLGLQSLLEQWYALLLLFTVVLEYWILGAKQQLRHKSQLGAEWVRWLIFQI